jgi:ubiquinone/menaquinone biosynthesis C-methylase UbiE
VPKTRIMPIEKAKEHSRDAFDRLAAKYENSLEGGHSRAMREAALNRLGRPIAGSLLDVGCGPGLLLEVLVEREEVSVAGIDISPEMIRVAKDRLGVRADLTLGDAESLPWKDDQFDCAFCVDSFHHYPNPERGLAEMHRVLKRGGRLLIADPAAPPVIRQVANLVNAFLRHGDVRIYTRCEMTRMLKAQGFEKIEWYTSGLWGFVVTALAL